MWHLLAAKPLNQNLHISSEPPPPPTPPTSGRGIAPCTTSPPVCRSKLWANSQITPPPPPPATTTAPPLLLQVLLQERPAKNCKTADVSRCKGGLGCTVVAVEKRRPGRPVAAGLNRSGRLSRRHSTQLYYYSLYQNFRMPSLFAHGCHLISNSGSGPVDEASIHAMHCGRQVQQQYVDIVASICWQQYFTTLKDSLGYLVSEDTHNLLFMNFSNWVIFTINSHFLIGNKYQVIFSNGK